MPEIEIEINSETGEMETTINGIAGPSCEKTAEAIKQVFGKPVRDEKTRFPRAIRCKLRQSKYQSRLRLRRLSVV